MVLQPHFIVKGVKGLPVTLGVCFPKTARTTYLHCVGFTHLPVAIAGTGFVTGQSVKKSKSCSVPHVQKRRAARTLPRFLKR